MIRFFTYLFGIYCFSILSGCSEGDLVEDTIDFQATLASCSNVNTDSFVFYKIDPSTNQTLALTFTNTTFEFDTVPENDETIIITLNGSANTLVHRTFDSAIDGDSYFCSNIPPNSANIIRELTGSDGTAEIRYTALTDRATDTTLTYIRTIVLLNTTLVGPSITYRNELLVLGEEEFTIPRPMEMTTM